MTTDGERREVAERLRAGVGMGMPLILNVAFAAFEVDPVSLDRTVTSDEAAMRLADLIDPDCEGGRYEGLRTVRPVDREALLALADELDETAWNGKVSDGWTASVVLTINRYTDRIRGACGEAAS